MVTMTGDTVTWSEGLRKQEAGLVDNIKLDTYINLVPKYPMDWIVQKDSSKTEDRTRGSQASSWQTRKDRLAF